MSDPLLYDWNESLDDPDLPEEAMRFFRAASHTLTIAPLIVADDIFYCIYSELKFTEYFGRDERSAFSCIESLSHLFTLDSSAFYNPGKMRVQYYAVSLNTDNSEKTVTANTILNAFAKNTPDYIVILFRHNNKCMLSFTKKTKDCMTFLSDWFDGENALDMIRKIDIVNLSLQNSDEFFCDFIYMAARKYYTHPVSKDYAYSEWGSSKLESDNEEEYFTKESRNEYITGLIYAHLYAYGDDYVEVANIDDFLSDNISESDRDYNFDLLIFELEEMMKLGVLESEDDEYNGDDDNDYDDLREEYGHIDVDDIPTEILDDPVKLLKWLGERRNENQNEEYNGKKSG